MALAMCALFIKIYQHHRLVRLTHAHQDLALEHASLMQECIHLHKQYLRESSTEKLYHEACSSHGMQPLTSQQIVTLPVKRES